MSELFSGIPVTNLKSSVRWYEQLLGYPADFYPDHDEAVWKLDEHQYFYLVEVTENAGHARLMQMLEGFDAHIEGITSRGVDYSDKEYFPNGICKITYSDPDGNQISFGGISSAPAETD